MPLDLNNLLNSTPVSPPHSNPRPQTSITASSNQTSAALLRSKLEEQSASAFPIIPLSQPFSFLLRPPIFNDKFNHRIPKQFYQKPIAITSFSFDHQRHIQCANHQFQSLRPLLDHVPHTGFDLNHGLDQAVFQDESIDEGLDGLLISLADFLEKSDPTKRLDNARGLLSSKLITWRGILTKFCSSAYETGGPNQGPGWAMNVMMMNGTLYIEEGSRVNIIEDIQGNGRPTYFGYSYESLMTNEAFQPVNTNEQWVPVVKSNLNGIRMILGGEVDAINCDRYQDISQNPHAYIEKNVDPNDFVEIKTSINPVTDRDHWNLHRYKLLKFWLQSYLLGTPKIHVGLRDRSGILCKTENYETIRIPDLVGRFGKPKCHWSSNLCLETGTRIIQMVINKFMSDLHDNQNQTNKNNVKINANHDREDGREEIGKNYSNRLSFFQDQLDSIVMEEFEYQKGIGRRSMVNEELSPSCTGRLNGLIDWPVYKMSLIPRYNGSNHQPQSHCIELIELDPDQVHESVLKAKSDQFFNYFNTESSSNPQPDGLHNRSSIHHRQFGNRIGFLPSFWVHDLIKLRIDLLLEKSFL